MMKMKAMPKTKDLALADGAGLYLWVRSVEQNLKSAGR